MEQQPQQQQQQNYVVAAPQQYVQPMGKEVTIYKNVWPLGIGKRLVVNDDGKSFEDLCREFCGPVAPGQSQQKIRLYCFSSMGDARALPNSVILLPKFKIQIFESCCSFPCFSMRLPQPTRRALIFSFSRTPSSFSTASIVVPLHLLRVLHSFSNFLNAFSHLSSLHPIAPLETPPFAFGAIPYSFLFSYYRPPTSSS
jgi:hypothetical protein